MIKRSVTIAGHRTSISLEAQFWEGLQRAADEDDRPLAELVREIDARRVAERSGNLSSAIRVWLYARALSQSG